MKQFSSNPESPYIETDFGDLCSFPLAAIYFIVIQEEKDNAAGMPLALALE